jgi:hypothetical protein
MLSHENIFFKIAEDFHSEINSILKYLEPTSNQSYWFDKKHIVGKLDIIEDILLSFNGNQTNSSEITRLKNTLDLYKNRLNCYFERNDLASGYYYYYPKTESVNKIIEYFDELEKKELSINSLYVNHIGGYLFMFGLKLIAFPTDCDLKFTGKVKDGIISIKEQQDPIFPIEIEEGKKIGNATISREQFNSRELPNEDYRLIWESEQKAKDYFKDFTEKIHIKNLNLINKFENCINLCKLIVEKKQNDTTPANLPEIEKTYSVLINGYIQEPLEKFVPIFAPEYSGEKIVWLKTGPELKYFIDRLNEKLDLSNEINKWAGQRFEFLEPVKNMTAYLSKQTSKGDYQLLNQGNFRKNPLYKLFRE